MKGLITLLLVWSFLIGCEVERTVSDSRRPVIVLSEQRVKVEKQKQKPEKKYSVGERFELGDFAYTITKVRAARKMGSRYNRIKAEKGSVFYVVNYDIENLGNETESVLTDDFLIVDDLKRKFKPCSEAITVLAMAGKKSMFLTQVQPGIKKSGVTAFKVPLESIKEEPVLVVPKKGLFSSGHVEVVLPSISDKKKI